MRVKKNQSILDIGCGPAGILAYLPNVEYYGFDISGSYISKAREVYGARGHFFEKYLTKDDVEALPKFDVVLLSGVLHHVDDTTARYILDLAYQSLKPNGRLVTIDGCLVKGQNPIARLLIKLDRGQNIKTEQGYKILVQGIFTKIEVNIQHTRWIPYTRCFMVCTK